MDERKNFNKPRKKDPEKKKLHLMRKETESVDERMKKDDER